jgi:S-adenosylmethionine hydrolase
VHVAIVDPQVGTERRGVALACGDGSVLVGPDNGLLSLAWQQLGGVELAVDITRSPHRLEPVSATFHGRDVFAPVAARLAAGADLAGAGERIDPEELETIGLPAPRVEDDVILAHALIVDRFGNVSLNVTHADLAGSGLVLGRKVEIEAGGERYLAVFAQTFADVKPGEVIVYEDAYRSLAIAVNRGEAAVTLQLAPDSEVRLSPR